MTLICEIVLNSEETPLGTVICVGSGKGGVGKTAVAVCLAACLAEAGKKTLLCDFSIPFGTADMFVSGGERAVFDLSDFACGRAELSETEVEVEDNLFFAASGKAVLSERELADCVKKIDRFAGRYDFVVADCPADGRLTVEKNFSKILSLCVTRPDPESVRSASVYAGLVSRLSPVWAKYILNCFSSNAVGKGNGLDLLTDRVGLPLLGVVPQSGEMAKCLCCGQSLKRGTAKGAFERIAGRICGQSIPLPDLGRI